MKEVLEISAGKKATVCSQRLHSPKLHKQKKNIISAALFLLLAGLTFYAVFHGNDMTAVAAAVRKMKPVYLLLAVGAGIFFVSAEGMMIWYLMHALDGRVKLMQCIKYSFIGFFFSGITPSATGGQPMQLYYMKKDKLKISESTVVLMTVAVIYKFVLVVIGGGMLIFAYRPLTEYLGTYIYLYYLGLLLNILLVTVLLLVMVRPRLFCRMVFAIERVLVRVHLLKPSQKRQEILNEFVERYHKTVGFFLQNKHRIVAVAAFTVLQRASVFLLTYLIYLGFSLKGTSAMTVIMLQASVYIAVDMLPLPGAQGITELMYKTIFIQVFPGTLLTASMCVTRGINFYFLLIVSAVVSLICYIKYKCIRKPS